MVIPSLRPPLSEGVDDFGSESGVLNFQDSGRTLGFAEGKKEIILEFILCPKISFGQFSDPVFKP